MKRGALFNFVVLLPLVPLVILAAAESASTFTSKQAKDAEKAYTKAMDRINAEYETKVKKARADYTKALESALKVMKQRKDSAEADRIAKAIEDLKREPLTPAKGGPAGQPEKIGDYTFSGGDGSSREQAVVIGGAEDSVGAVAAESAWLKRHYPNWTKGAQALLGGDGKKYDRIAIRSPSGEEKTIYFDITTCFGFPTG